MQILKKYKEPQTEAEYSAELIRLLFAIIKWLIIAIFLIIVLFLGTMIFVLTNDNIEIEVGRLNNEQNTVVSYTYLL